MKIYLAYKFANVKNKQELKEELLQISDKLTGQGNEVFILGRDVQNWDNRAHSVRSKMAIMFKNLKNSDLLLVYLNSNVMSWGLLFELLVATLLFKKVIRFSSLDEFQNKIITQL